MSEEEELKAMLAELNDGLEEMFNDLEIATNTKAEEEAPTNDGLEEMFRDLEIATKAEVPTNDGLEEMFRELGIAKPTDEEVYAARKNPLGGSSFQGVRTSKENVEAIVSAFVGEYTPLWKVKSPTFLHNNENETTEWVPFPKDLRNEFITMDDFRIQTCRGINNDCIVNSLLTCLSPTFRRLEPEFKDKVASYYRYEKLLPMYSTYINSAKFSDVTAKERAEGIEREILSGIANYVADSKKEITTGYGGLPISAEVATVFGILHGINVLIKESEVREKGAFTLLGPHPKAKEFIIIHNTEGIHYSSISDSSNNYIFPISMLKKWDDEIEKRQKTLNKSKCPFITNQVLRYQGKLYIVVNAENTDDNKECKNIYVHELISDNDDVTGYIQDIKDILLIQKALIVPTFPDPDKEGYDYELHVVLQVEWDGIVAGATNALTKLKVRYPTIFNKDYTFFKDVYTDAQKLPFINIKGQSGYELAYPNVKDKDGVPSMYVASASASALLGGGGSKRKTRRRKNLTNAPH